MRRLVCTCFIHKPLKTGFLVFFFATCDLDLYFNLQWLCMAFVTLPRQVWRSLSQNSWLIFHLNQAFRFMVGLGHCMYSKYGPSPSKAVGPVDPFFLVVIISPFNKKYSSYSKSMNSTKQKVHVRCQYSKTCLKQSLKKDKTKIFMLYNKW